MKNGEKYMKKGFTSLSKKARTTIVVLFYALAGIFFIVIGVVPNEDPWPYILVPLFLVSLTFAILFTVWNSKTKKVEKKNTLMECNADKRVQETDEQFGMPGNFASSFHPSSDTLNSSVSQVPSRIRFTPEEASAVDVFSFDYPKDRKFVFIDVETATRANDKICAIGLIIVDGGVAKDMYSLINPKVHITNTSIHGISDEDVEDAPTFEEYWDSVKSLIGDDFVFVAHNANFDRSVLDKELSCMDSSFNPKMVIDTMWVAKDILYGFNAISGDLKLDTLCDRLGVTLNHHNAGSDIAATKEVLEKLLLLSHRNIEEFINIRGTPGEVVVGNIKKCRAEVYWDDIKVGRKPPYFTNFHDIEVTETPHYDEVNLVDLLKTSMMNREGTGIKHIEKESKTIKEVVTSLNGKIYGKGAKSAKSYIEFYYMDDSEYLKMKEKGVKIFHAMEVMDFLESHQDEINAFKQEQEQRRLAEEEETARKAEEKKAKQEKKKSEAEAKKNTPKRYVFQYDDSGTLINRYACLNEAARAVGVDHKCIADCINGKQKHAAGFVWKFDMEKKDDVDSSNTGQGNEQSMS